MGDDALNGQCERDALFFFSYVDLEKRVPSKHPLLLIRLIVNDVVVSLDVEFDTCYTDFGRPSNAPERLIRVSLIQILFSIRSERLLVEQMNYNLLFRWFVGLGIDDVVWVPTVFFTKNRDRTVPPLPWSSFAPPFTWRVRVGIGEKKKGLSPHFPSNLTFFFSPL